MRFIAEMSGNHGGSLEKAHELIVAAASAGATHFKMQTYTPDSITMKSSREEFKVSRGHPLWGGRTLYELYSQAQTPYAWHPELFEHARSEGMVPFSTPFDEAAVQFLEDLDTPLYKVASLEIVDLPLIREVSQTGKPVILSTGTANLQEVDDAVEVARDAGCKDLTILVCTSDYPAQPALANLARIPFLKERYQVSVGLSDHTIGTSVSNAAIALGARSIEKHITLDPTDGGVDSRFSASPNLFGELVREGREVLSAIGRPDAWGLPGEQESRGHRPSLIAVMEIKEGEEFTHRNIRTLRPNIGLEPKYIGAIIGKKASRKLFPGHGLQREDVHWD